MSDPSRPWITCHVLDTSLGKPAADIAVTLTHNSSTYPVSFSGQTNKDGRVESWSLITDQPIEHKQHETLNELIAHLKTTDCQSSRWVLTFDTEPYYTETFFDGVTINFTTDVSEAHYHVPLLLSPYGYSTYRGS